MSEHNSKSLSLKGRARVIDVDNVDTDMIFHNRHLHITNRSEMAQHIFGNLKGYENFPKSVKGDDILVVGHNFGCGSSRQQAVDGFIELGIAAIIGESFGAIYKRNCINAGLPLVECPGITSMLSEGDNLTLNLEIGTVFNHMTSSTINGKPFSEVQRDIYFAGGLMELAQAGLG